MFNIKRLRLRKDWSRYRTAFVCGGLISLNACRGCTRFRFWPALLADMWAFATNVLNDYAGYFFAVNPTRIEASVPRATLTQRGAHTSTDDVTT